MIQLTSIPAPGSPETCPNCKAATGKSKSDGKPYEQYFDDQERAEFDQIAASHPDLVPMLPPKDGVFKTRSIKDTADARGRYRKARKKAGMTGNGDDLHHPHSIKTGGCPIHQTLVQKPQGDPTKDPEVKRVQDVDDQINAITNRAIARNPP